MSTMIIIRLLLFPALMVLAEAQSCYNSSSNSVRFMPYWIAKQGEADRSLINEQIVRLGTGPQDTPLYHENGTELARVDKATADTCKQIGTCILFNGDLLSVEVPKFTYRKVDKTKFPFGVGSWDNPLEPFVSVAAADVPFRTTLCVRELENFQLPNNETHNGCVRVDDHMGIFPEPSFQCAIALFVLEFPYSVRLQVDLPNASVYSCSCKVLNYTTPDMYAFVNGDTSLPHPIHDQLVACIHFQEGACLASQVDPQV